MQKQNPHKYSVCAGFHGGNAWNRTDYLNMGIYRKRSAILTALRSLYPYSVRLAGVGSQFVLVATRILLHRLFAISSCLIDIPAVSVKNLLYTATHSTFYARDADQFDLACQGENRFA